MGNGKLQKSASCDRIIGGLARYDFKYQQLKDSLINGPLSEFKSKFFNDQWVTQISNATMKPIKC